ncbi:hypothetical protein [Methylocapsa aurea]|uniref:hypothetical protein n=1 Tax=Methylocapsa aurea TaxID=663610 RepID=UPI0012EB6CE4|nr:hypothetical protein [Methylocapsa aurea]
MSIGCVPVPGKEGRFASIGSAPDQCAKARVGEYICIPGSVAPMLTYRIYGAAALLLLCGVLGASARTGPSFFVVLSAFDAYAGDATFSAAERGKRAAAECGIEAWTEYTSKIRGFRPGYFAVLLGPYRTRLEAEALRRRVAPCAPGAYVKSGVDLGE